MSTCALFSAHGRGLARDLGGTAPGGPVRKSACTCPSAPTRARRGAARRWHRRGGRPWVEAGPAAGDIPPPPLIVRAHTRGDHAVFRTRGSAAAHAPPKVRQLKQADAEDPRSRTQRRWLRSATAPHRHGVRSTPPSRVRAPGRGSGGRSLRRAGPPRRAPRVTAEEGGQLTHRVNRVVLNHEDAHTPIVVAITRICAYRPLKKRNPGGARGSIWRTIAIPMSVHDAAHEPSAPPSA